jgi:SAM-dependent methyltransferase
MSQLGWAYGLWSLVLSQSVQVFAKISGTNIYAAEQNPECQVIGIDLSEIQPTWRLSNCSFVQDESEDEWLFGSTENPIQFDYVHLRQVLTCFNDPRTVVRHAYKRLKPGGWIEYTDTCMDLKSIDNNIQGVYAISGGNHSALLDTDFT